MANELDGPPPLANFGRPMTASDAAPIDTTLSQVAFGSWLKTLREKQGKLQRELAAAAAMDSSHLGKVERGERPPSREQALAFARCLGVDATEMGARYAAMRLYEACGGDPSVLHAAGGLAQEVAGPYVVNKSANNRAKKK